MVRTLRSSRSPIGIDVDGRSFNAVQLERRGSVWRVVAATSVQRSDPDLPVDVDEVRRFGKVMERQGFTGRRAILSVPSDRLISAVLELPPAESGAPWDEITRVELAAAHQCEPTDIELAYWELPKSTTNRSGVAALAVGCRHADANAVLDIFESAGVDVRGLDVRSCALQRAATPILKDAKGLSAILNIEWSAASFVVVLNGVLIYERIMTDAGLGDLHGQLIEELGLDADVVGYLIMDMGLDAAAIEDQAQQALTKAVRDRINSYLDALASELRLSISYVCKEYGRDRVEQMLVVGAAAGVPGIVDHLSTECAVRGVVLTPSHLAEEGGQLPAESASPSLTTAFGLAQYPMGSER